MARVFSPINESIDQISIRAAGNQFADLECAYRDVSEAALFPRANKADGYYRRGFAAYRPFDRIFYRRRTCVADISDSAILRHSQRSRAIGGDLADTRARAGFDGTDRRNPHGPLDPF